VRGDWRPHAATWSCASVAVRTSSGGWSSSRLRDLGALVMDCQPDRHWTSRHSRLGTDLMRHGDGHQPIWRAAFGAANSCTIAVRRVASRGRRASCCIRSWGVAVQCSTLCIMFSWPKHLEHVRARAIAALPGIGSPLCRPATSPTSGARRRVGHREPASPTNIS
jgi:hypothetical protein